MHKDSQSERPLATQFLDPTLQFWSLITEMYMFPITLRESNSLSVLDSLLSSITNNHDNVNKISRSWNQKQNSTLIPFNKHRYSSKSTNFTSKTLDSIINNISIIKQKTTSIYRQTYSRVCETSVFVEWKHERECNYIYLGSQCDTVLT